MYKIDYTKVKTLEDVIRILKTMDLSCEDEQRIQSIKDLVFYVEKPEKPIVNIHDNTIHE